MGHFVEHGFNILERDITGDFTAKNQFGQTLQPAQEDFEDHVAGRTLCCGSSNRSSPTNAPWLTEPWPKVDVPRRRRLARFLVRPAAGDDSDQFLVPGDPLAGVFLRPTLKHGL